MKRALVLTPLLLLGCGKKLEETLPGTYSGAVELPAGMPAAAAKALANPTLELKVDKTYTLTMVVPMTGKWTLAEKTLSLTPETVGGRPVAQMRAQMGMIPGADKLLEPFVFMVAEDGKTLDIQNGVGKMKFTRTGEAR